MATRSCADQLSGPGCELLRFFRPHVEREARRVTASMYGLGRRTAIFREGLGWTLVADRTEDELRAQAFGVFSPPPASNPDALWPEGERVDLEILPQGVDHLALEAGVEVAFAEPDSDEDAPAWPTTTATGAPRPRIGTSRKCER
jgi:hypothetical protein